MYWLIASRHVNRRTRALVVGLVSVLGAGAVSPPSAAISGDGAVTASVSGDVHPFGPNSDPRAGLTVRILEQPTLTAVTDASGDWRIDGVPVGSTATFALDGGERPPIQSATFTVPAGGLEQVAFQSPDHSMFAALEALLDVERRPDRCHIASTVTRRGYSLYGGAADGTHGEPGATVSISPAPAEGDGPIYFNGSSFDIIWPDPALEETTADGGVLFTNIPPGTYTLTARKVGATIRSVTVGCRGGVLTNAAPPWGLQVTGGGLDLDETVPFPSPTSAATHTDTTTSSAVVGDADGSTGVAAPAAAAIPVAAGPTYTG